MCKKTVVVPGMVKVMWDVLLVAVQGVVGRTASRSGLARGTPEPTKATHLAEFLLNLAGKTAKSAKHLTEFLLNLLNLLELLNQLN